MEYSFCQKYRRILRIFWVFLYIQCSESMISLPNFMNIEGGCCSSRDRNPILHDHHQNLQSLQWNETMNHYNVVVVVFEVWMSTLWHPIFYLLYIIFYSKSFSLWISIKKMGEWIVPWNKFHFPILLHLQQRLPFQVIFWFPSKKKKKKINPKSEPKMHFMCFLSLFS